MYGSCLKFLHTYQLKTYFCFIMRIFALILKTVRLFGDHLHVLIQTRFAFKKLRTIAWRFTVIKEELLKCFNIAFAEATLFSVSCVSSS